MAVGASQPFPPLSSGSVAIDEPWLRFHIPLVERDGPISGIPLLDKTSCLRPRKPLREHRQTNEPPFLIQVRVRVPGDTGVADLVLLISITM